MHSARDTQICQARRIVVKVGSNVLSQSDGLNRALIASLSRQICRLIDGGREVILVSSGAMAAGLRRIGLARRPDEIPKRQAVAAVGQAGLIQAYEKAFGRHGKQVAQLLLTGEDLRDRKRYLNARNTLLTLLEWRIVPIINENDTVVVDEIKFGDNDNLAAMITLLMDADLLINLSDIDGLYSADPRTTPGAELIPEVLTIGRTIERIALGLPGALGTGGMGSKIKAARKVTAAGHPMVIASGAQRDVLLRLCDGEALGTYFAASEAKLASRKCWIGFTLKPLGCLLIDDGAAAAVLQRGKSLLPSGIVAVRGEFDVGAPVELRNSAETVLGMGLVNYASADIRLIQGLKSSQIRARLGHKPYDEVIHRDNLTVTCEAPVTVDGEMVP
jgi:glutamate 5-kinase